MESNLDISNNNMVLNMIMRQTDYTKETATKELKKWNNNHLQVIKAYLNPDFKKNKLPEKHTSLNQRIMQEIRIFCDNGIKQYNSKQDMILKQMLLDNESIQKTPSSSSKNNTQDTPD